jgi:hypothetical protein
MRPVTLSVTVPSPLSIVRVAGSAMPAAIVPSSPGVYGI